MILLLNCNMCIYYYYISSVSIVPLFFINTYMEKYKKAQNFTERETEALIVLIIKKYTIENKKNWKISFWNWLISLLALQYHLISLLIFELYVWSCRIPCLHIYTWSISTTIMKLMIKHQLIHKINFNIWLMLFNLL